MKRLTTLCILLTGLAAVTACIPEKRITWSFDGQTAALSGASGLFFFDADGKLLAPRLERTTARPAWFSDSRRLAIAHTTEAAGWKEIAPVLTPDQIKQVEQSANTMKERILAYKGDWDKFKLDPGEAHSPGAEAAVLFYLRDKLSEGLPEKLGDKWSDLQKASATIWQLQLFDFSTTALSPGKVLLRSLDEIWMPSVSPSGSAIAYLSKNDETHEDAVGLFVLGTSGGEPKLVHANVAMGFDWSSDGRSLAFHCGPADGDNDKSVMLGSLSTIEVAGPDGEPLQTFNKQEDHIGLLFSQLFGVEWLKDGRLLFSSVEFTLPATNRDMPQRWTLFLHDPRMPASAQRVLPRDFDQPMEMTSALFQLSPDERRVLIPGTKGRLYLHEFASGETKAIQSENVIERAQILPMWRNAEQFTFVRPLKSAEGKEGGELVIWKGDAAQPIGKTWPTETHDEWLTPQ